MTLDIRGFLETSLLDWDGKISSVIFLSGCNLKCSFCHNYPLVFEPEKLKKFELKDIRKFLEEHKNWVDAVVISGGEPTIYKDLASFIKEIRSWGFLIKLDTNGTNPRMLKGLIEQKLVDYIAMDVKGPQNGKYEVIAGCKVNLKGLKESIDLIKRSAIDYEFRTTVVPGQLDTDDIKELARNIAGAKRFIIQQFVPENARDEALRKVKPYSKEKLVEMAGAAKEFVPHTIVRGA